MFYVPYKFKSQNEPTTPKGPSFESSPTQAISFNGTNLYIKAPKHKTNLRCKKVNPKREYSLTNDQFQTIDSTVSKWKSVKFFSKIWDFNGHQFMGSVGNLSCVGIILRLPTQPKDTSFFHPTYFENSVSDYLCDFFSTHEDRFRKDEPYRWLYRAPENWELLEVGLGFQAARFNIVKNSDWKRRIQQCCIMLPISDKDILTFTFWIHRDNNLTNDIPLDKWINPQPFIELREQIIGSIKVELSEDAKKQRELALQGVANPKLSETFAPIDWPKDGVLKEKFDIENDDGWGEYS